MTEDQIKARLSDEARSWTEREERRRIADAAFMRARRHTRNIEALLAACALAFVASLVALVILGVTR